MQLLNVPCLREARFAGDYCKVLAGNLETMISSYTSNLETLAMQPVVRVRFSEFPTLTNLKELELILSLSVDDMGDDDLLSCISLIRTCPLLCRFVLRLRWTIDDQKGIQICGSNPINHPHRCLKFVEIFGFYGSAAMVLARYLVKNSSSLERTFLNIFYRQSQEEKNVARECLRQLQSELPPGAELLLK